MGYENDPFMDEDGEPLMDPDAQSDREASPDPQSPVDDDEEDDGWRRSRSPTPVMSEGKGGKPRKRLVKKSGNDATPSPARSDSPGNGLDDWEEEEEEPASSSKKRKGYDLLKAGMGKGENLKKDKKEKSKKKKDRASSSRGERAIERGGKGWTPSGPRGKDQGADPEMKELWDTIAGDSEDDQEAVRTLDDDAFIDDTGVDPADRYGGSDNEGSAGNAPQAEEGEEDDEINKLFKGGQKKKKKNEKTAAELGMLVEQCIAELEVTAEADAELNRQSKPAINKLKKLPMLIDVLSKKTLQNEFLDRGALTLLKNWLEPLPDGSMPNTNVRTAILNILTDFPIDLYDENRRDLLKRSGLGKVIMFLSKSDEETTANRKLAKELVDKWSRPIFNKSTRFEDMRGYDDDKMPYRRPPAKKPVNKSTGLESREDDLDEFSQGPKSGQGASRQHASRPEATPLDFLVRPQSKIDPEEIRARAKQQVQDQRRLKMNKKLQQLKAPKKKQLQASKLSVEGRGMVKYL